MNIFIIENAGDIVGIYSTMELAKEARARRLNFSDKICIKPCDKLENIPEEYEKGPLYRIQIISGVEISELRQELPIDYYRHPASCLVHKFDAVTIIYSPISFEHAIQYYEEWEKKFT